MLSKSTARSANNGSGTRLQCYEDALTILK
jgi:hypothetical protein